MSVFAVQRLLTVLEEEAQQLECWANEAESGGWSTIHVRPMRQRANELWGVVGRARIALHNDDSDQPRG